MQFLVECCTVSVQSNVSNVWSSAHYAGEFEGATPYCNNLHGYIKQRNVNNKKESIVKIFSEFWLIFVFKTNLMNKSKTLSKVWSSTTPTYFDISAPSSGSSYPKFKIC